MLYKLALRNISSRSESFCKISSISRTILSSILVSLNGYKSIKNLNKIVLFLTQNVNCYLHLQHKARGNWNEFHKPISSFL